MALAASGQISISQINTELGRTSTTANTSLTQCSDGTNGTINTANAAADRPDRTAPHSMSEFYSYNHTLSALKDFLGTTFSERGEVCGNEPETKYWHDGSGESPAIRDLIYTDSAGSTELSDGWIGLSTTTGLQYASEVKELYLCRKK